MALSADEKNFVGQIRSDLRARIPHTKTTVEKLGRLLGITDQTLIKELTELAIIQEARSICLRNQHAEPREIFELIVGLYRSQVNLSHRTSQSMLLQQYSTPAPVAYLMGHFCGIDKPLEADLRCFEPSAGNGMLTIAGHPSFFEVNEVDPVRSRILSSQGFERLTRQDGSEPFPRHRGRFNAVLTNPPFGSLRPGVQYGEAKITALEHLMALYGLEAMADSGRAAIIIGGHTKWDSQGRIQKGKNRIFFSYLYHHYYVRDVIQLDGKKLYSRMGTGFNVRLILIEGRKSVPSGVAPLKGANDRVVKDHETLFLRVEDHVRSMQEESAQRSALFNRDPRIVPLRARSFDPPGLNGPYRPAAQSCNVLDTLTPDSMDSEIHATLKRLRSDLGRPVEAFVQEKLGYNSSGELCEVLSAEQIDAVALSIYNIEFRGQGMIIGDQTGIGKGRVAAAMIRYACLQGLTPIFLTEKANLFSDLYRDLLAIGSGNLKPFIVNSRDKSTRIKAPNGKLIHEAPDAITQERMLLSRHIKGNYDFIMATYSQFSSGNHSIKKDFLVEMAKDNVMVLDESHNASGSSNTGSFLKAVLRKAWGVTYLSATYAKRPDNMPVYAMKTCMQDANMTSANLIGAIEKGGVALQEVVSAQLVQEGQMIRRERTYQGIEVNYITLDSTASHFGLPDLATEHRRISDEITYLIRELIEIQADGIRPMVNALDKQLAKKGIQVEQRKGTKRAGADSTPYFSRVFNLINQMLLSIKAEAAAQHAIARLREGKKPVIALSSTLGSFVDQLETLDGGPVEPGARVFTDFTEILMKGLETIRKITVSDGLGNTVPKLLEVHELPIKIQVRIRSLEERMRRASSGITISPIDLVKQRITEAGYSVAEVTGRSHEIHLDLPPVGGLNGLGKVVDSSGRLIEEIRATGTLQRRQKVPAQDAFRRFNNNEVDCLVINQSGSTGASAHAIPTSSVPASEVKQRVMIVLQPELDINTEVQKRGRINRTGQIHKPIYDYLISAIPAEQRLLMMLQSKLKSLDANTASNQKQSKKLLSTSDFLNKIGDKVVNEYLLENPSFGMRLDLDYDGDKARFRQAIDAKFITGRVAVLQTAEQEKFYSEIIQRYADRVEMLQQQGRYDLEVDVLDLQARTLNKAIVIQGNTTDSIFGDDTFLERVQVKNLSRPLTRVQVEERLREHLQGRTGKEVQLELLEEFQGYFSGRKDQQLQDLDERLQTDLDAVTEGNTLRQLEAAGAPADEILDFIEEQKAEINEEFQKRREKVLKRFSIWESSVLGTLRFFYPGRALSFPTETGHEDHALCLGVQIDRSRENPWAPSALKVQIAIAGPQRYLSLPPSGEGQDLLLKIRGASPSENYSKDSSTRSLWDQLSAEANTAFETRFVITGNLLQGFSRFKGKLISYTLRDGGEQKGILMPKNWQPSDDGADEVTVSVRQIEPFLKSLPMRKAVMTEMGISFQRMTIGGYKIIAPGSMRKGGEFYLNSRVLNVVRNGLFTKVSDRMVGEIEPQNLAELLRIMADEFGDTILLSPDDYRKLSPTKAQTARRQITQAQPRDPEPHSEWLKIISVRAQALALQLELLTL